MSLSSKSEKEGVEAAGIVSAQTQCSLKLWESLRIKFRRDNYFCPLEKSTKLKLHQRKVAEQRSLPRGRESTT